MLRASDVPPYVERGGAHLGIAGKDTLLEYGSDMLCEPVDLQLSKCRLMTAIRRDLNFHNWSNPGCHKIVIVARQYLHRKVVKLIQLSFMERWNGSDCGPS